LESRMIYSELMNTAGFGFSVLGDDEFERIHHATLEIMRTTGLHVGDDEALDILDGGGAIVDRKTKTVKFPAFLVEDCIRSAPSTFIQYGRESKNDVFLGGKRVNFSTFGQGVNVMETDGTVRPSVQEDVGKAARLADALEEINVCERSLTAGDAPEGVAPIWEAETVFANTSKHTIYGPGNGWRADKIIKMAQAIVGGEEALREKPILTINCSPTSPLSLDEPCCTGIMTAAKAGVPCNLISMVMAGASGPITLAGSLVVHNCEMLAGIVLHQLTRKGSPVIYGCSSLMFDLKLMGTPVGSPECGMLNAAAPVMAQKYGLPSFSAGG
jgi:trimethylamine---corrinoid protein Co-methyltransferase